MLLVNGFHSDSVWNWAPLSLVHKTTLWISATAAQPQQLFPTAFVNLISMPFHCYDRLGGSCKRKTLGEFWSRVSESWMSSILSHQRTISVMVTVIIIISLRRLIKASQQLSRVRQPSRWQTTGPEVRRPVLEYGCAVWHRGLTVSQSLKNWNLCRRGPWESSTKLYMICRMILRVHMLEYNPSLHGGLNWGGGSFARYCKPLMELNPWHSYGVSLAIWDHTVLPAIPDTSERTPPSPQPDRLVLDLPTI